MNAPTDHIDWKAALDSHFGAGNWDENGHPIPEERPGRDPYQGMAMNRAAHGDPTAPASAGLPTLGKKR